MHDSIATDRHFRFRGRFSKEAAHLTHDPHKRLHKHQLGQTNEPRHQPVLKKAALIPLLEGLEKIGEDQAKQDGFQEGGREHEDANHHHRSNQAGAAAHQFHTAVVLLQRGRFFTTKDFLRDTQGTGDLVQALLLSPGKAVIRKRRDEQSAQQRFLFLARQHIQPSTHRLHIRRVLHGQHLLQLAGGGFAVGVAHQSRH